MHKNFEIKVSGTIVDGEPEKLELAIEYLLDDKTKEGIIFIGSLCNETTSRRLQEAFSQYFFNATRQDVS